MPGCASLVVVDDSPIVLRHDILERSGPQSRLLVLLHGYGESPLDLTDRIDLLDPDGRWLAVAPDAPFERKGRAIWHRALTTDPAAAARQFDASLDALDALLGALQAETGLAAADAVVGGFSQGGGLGIGLLLRADITNRPAAGFGVCSFPPAFPGFRADRTAAAGRPYYLSSAHRDRYAPIEASRGGAALLRTMGLDLTYAETAGEHVMTDEAAVGVGQWLDALADGRAPERGADLLAGVSGRNEFYEELWELVG